jgi:ferric-dicitrate binding protein FerR (iron transport regulator)
MNSKFKYRFYHLLERQKRGLSSETEEKMLTEWFENAPVIDQLTFASEEEKNEIKADMLKSIDDRIKHLSVPGETINRTIHPSRSEGKLISGKKWWTLAAAAMLLCVVLPVYFFSGSETENIIVSVPKGVEKMPVTLPDSSVVWLSGESTISFPEKFADHHRDVKLSGTGYFSVRPDKHAPFTVKTTAAISVKVLGTSFVVNTTNKEKNVKISVITGRVQVDENKHTLDVLNPKESLVYAPDTKTFTRDQYAAAEMDEWSNNSTVVLNNVSLGELSVLLHVMYRVDLIYKDNLQMKRYRFNLNFPKDKPVDELADMLSKVSGLTFSRNGSKLSITN